MQVSRIINTIQDVENNQYNTRCANTGSHTCLTTLIIEIRPNSTPLLLAHTCSQLLTSTSWSNLCWISRLIVVDCTQSQQRLHAQEVTNTFVLPSWVEAWCKCDLFMTAYMVHYPSSGVLVLAHSQIERALSWPAQCQICKNCGHWTENCICSPHEDCRAKKMGILPCV